MEITYVNIVTWEILSVFLRRRMRIIAWLKRETGTRWWTSTGCQTTSSPSADPLPPPSTRSGTRFTSSNFQQIRYQTRSDVFHQASPIFAKSTFLASDLSNLYSRKPSNASAGLHRRPQQLLDQPHPPRNTPSHYFYPPPHDRPHPYQPPKLPQPVNNEVNINGQIGNTDRIDNFAPPPATSYNGSPQFYDDNKNQYHHYDHNNYHKTNHESSNPLRPTSSHKTFIPLSIVG